MENEFLYGLTAFFAGLVMLGTVFNPAAAAGLSVVAGVGVGASADNIAGTFGPDLEALA